MARIVPNAPRPVAAPVLGPGPTSSKAEAGPAAPSCAATEPGLASPAERQRQAALLGAPESVSAEAVAGSLALGEANRPDLGRYTLNAMAPLLVGDPNDLDSPASQQAWANFENQLKAAKERGVEALSTDVWWGMVEPEDNTFNFAYYDRMAQAVERAGLKWVPILSFHQCGGNVGDDVNVPIPSWLGEKWKDATPLGDDEGIFSKSEQNNVNRESISPWATRATLTEFAELMRAFQAHFADRASMISEINISLGPAGELRYPSYNSHDSGTDYPSRGALQAYSDLAVESFRAFAMHKYGGLKGVKEAWGAQLGSSKEIRPPDDANGFFARADDRETQYGRDLFDWYNRSLINHGKRLLTKAIEVFNGEGAPFKGVELGAKVPGIHWRIGSDRQAELNAGLLRSSEVGTTWNSDDAGHGYEKIVGMFQEIGQRPDAPKIVMHFTCGEMDDGDGGPAVASRAKSLVGWVGNEAKQESVPIKLENALSFTLCNPRSWENLEGHLDGAYEGLTVLRIGELVSDPVASEGFQKLAKKFD